MPAAVTIYHNPRCSKSRATLQLFADAGVEAQIVEYLKTPPSSAELDILCSRLGMEPRELVRFNEPVATDLGLAPSDERSRSEWLRLLSENPILLERPIVVKAETARLGRPPEAVRELIE